MKKYCFFIMLIFAGTFSYGQTLQEINEMMGKSQYKKAKEGIDKFLGDPKNAAKSDGWFYKGRIYNAVSKDSTMTSTEALKLKTEAFEAFKKYQQMDAKELPFILENHGSYFDLYNGFFDVGAKEFNSKNFAASFEGFKNAIVVEDYVRSKGYDYNGFKFPIFDTALILNTAIAAGNAKDTPSSVIYYKKLADQNLASPDYLNIYQYLVEYYLGKNDQTNFNAMMEKGRMLFPHEKYWTEIEIDIVAKTGNKEALNAKYEELMKRYPEEFSWPYNLAVEIYNELYSGESKIANSEALKTKLTEIIKAAIAVDKGIDAKTLMTRHLYNAAYDYQDSSKKIKGVKPEDVKKRADAKAMFLKKIDECIPYAEGVTSYYGAMATLKPIQKANYKIILDLLSQMYATKGDLKKSAEYDKKKSELN